MKISKKHIIKSMLNGMYLMKRENHAKVSGYKLYSGKMVPEIFFSEKLINNELKYDLFKTDARQKITLNLSSIRKMHGNHWIKKMYTQHRAKK
ncbi:MAG: hypothetical protein ABIN89_13365 [Chitinophagaceae bacterium]